MRRHDLHVVSRWNIRLVGSYQPLVRGLDPGHPVGGRTKSAI